MLDRAEINPNRKRTLRTGVERKWLWYNDGGWAFLQRRDGSQTAIKELAWKKVAVEAGDGRIAINTLKSTSPSTYSAVWLQDAQHTFDSFTLAITTSLRLTFHVCRAGKAQEDGDGPGVVLDPRVFWDVRDIKSGLCVDYGSDELHNNWVADNWKNLCRHFGAIGFRHHERHAFRSEKSWNVLNETKKGKAEDGAVAGVMGRDYLEDFSVSTLSMLFGFLHWSKKLGSVNAKASAIMVLNGASNHALQQ